MERLKKISFIELVDAIMYFCCFNLGFYLLNSHHTALHTAIWWLFCSGFFIIFKMIPSEKIKRLTAFSLIILMICTKLFSIFIVAYTFAICALLFKLKRIAATANIFFFQIIYFLIVLYLKTTNQSIGDYQKLYLVIWILLISRVVLAAISLYTKSNVQKSLSVSIFGGSVLFGIFILTVYLVPLFRNFFSWLVSSFARALGYMVGPLYQSIAQIFIKQNSTSLKTKEMFFKSVKPGQTQTYTESILLETVNHTAGKFLMILLVFIVFYGFFKFLKSLRKIKINTNSLYDVKVDMIEQISIPSTVEYREYTDSIDKLLNKIFTIAAEKGIPKEENQSIRKWASELPFQVSEEWLLDFENIRYNEATNDQLNTNFHQQSLAIIHQLNQKTINKAL